MKWIIAAVVLLLVFLTLKVRAQMSGNFENIDVSEFKLKMQAKDAVILDVRTPRETASGKIKNAIEIDVTASGFENEVSKLDKSKTYLVYCRSGNRSATACSRMSKLGFEKLYNLKGGYMSWKKQ